MTDSSFRNRAIREFILQSDRYQFITFEPTAITGLPARVNPGEEVTFTLDGDLTIRDITLPVTFDVTAAAVSATQLQGSASTVVNRADFNLSIPSVPNVANVEEAVELTIEFIANSRQ